MGLFFPNSLIGRCVLALALVLFQPGCAIVYEKNGIRYTTGLVQLKQPVGDQDEEKAGDALSVATIGLGVLVLPSGTVVSLGYGKETIVALKNNKLVCGEFGDGHLSVQPIYRCAIEKEDNHVGSQED